MIYALKSLLDDRDCARKPCAIQLRLAGSEQLKQVASQQLQIGHLRGTDRYASSRLLVGQYHSPALGTRVSSPL